MGETGLSELSRRPHPSPNRNVLDKEIGWISALRKRRLGSRRVQSELLRNYAFSCAAPHSAKFFGGWMSSRSREVESCVSTGIGMSVRFRANACKLILVKSINRLAGIHPISLLLETAFTNLFIANCPHFKFLFHDIFINSRHSFQKYFQIILIS